ncbi:MAG: cache domain-containing protein, partial [Methanothrix sp.]|nr:cache domain-containing protein [Methanothrix sp.]
MTLFIRFFLLLVLSALLPVLAAGAWFLHSTERAQESAQHMHMQLAQLCSSMVEEEIGRLNRSLAFVERLGSSKAAAEQDYKVLQQAILAYPGFVLLSVADDSGAETVRVADTTLFPDPASRPPDAEVVIRQAKATESVAISSLADIHGRPILALAHPLPDGRILYAAYVFSALWHRLQALKVGLQGRMLLLDKESKPLPDIAEAYPQPAWGGPGPLSGDSGWLASIRTARGAMVGAFVTTPSLKWRVLSLQPREEAFAVGERFALQAASFILGLGTVMVLISLWITRSLTRPLHA